jgi:hypothetical protein
VFFPGLWAANSAGPAGRRIVLSHWPVPRFEVKILILFFSTMAGDSATLLERIDRVQHDVLCRRRPAPQTARSRTRRREAREVIFIAVSFTPQRLRVAPPPANPPPPGLAAGPSLCFAIGRPRLIVTFAITGRGQEFDFRLAKRGWRKGDKSRFGAGENGVSPNSFYSTRLCDSVNAHCFFRGRPRGRSVNSKPSCLAVLCCHTSSPNGQPR